jgi:hypothetical protein
MSRFSRFLRNLFGDSTPISQPRRTRLGLSALEAREVPAIDLVGTTLAITGTTAGDTVTVRTTGLDTPTTIDDNVTATRTAVTFTSLGPVIFSEMRTFNIGLVSGIQATLGEGNNRFENKTHLNAVAEGGSGKDTFIGGTGADFFKGLGGNDTLFGGGGPDILHGDTGNDRLYGGGGTDQLLGGSGTNGLYGGYGMDFLWGGSGSDRFLLGEAGDYIQGGYSSEKDAILRFENTTSNVTVNMDGGTGTFDNDSWSQTDIERVDAALAVLHEAKGSPVFLRYDGDDLEFRRVGEWLSGQGQNVLGWNGDTGVITLTEKTFAGSDALVHEVVLHEIGHNWDETDENASVGQFRAISGWTIPEFGAWGLPGYSLSGDGNWSHFTDADFTRPYAKTNPKEDFAESFMTYWMHQMGEQSTMASKHYEDLTEKMAYMEDFVNNVG